MKRFALSCAMALGCIIVGQGADDFPREEWLRKAALAMPKLKYREVKPKGLVSIARDHKAFQGWKAQTEGPMEELYGKLLKSGDAFVVDFGEHLVGRLSLDLGERTVPADAPIRLKFTFAEVPLEIGEAASRYTGWLCSSWLQEDTVTIDFVPTTYTLPRRYAFRYVRIEVLGCPKEKPLILRLSATAESSADESKLKPWKAPSPAAAKLDEIARCTLRDCMQTMFEDGPKRDRRLWLGDLRIEALANYETYRQFDVVKRSLYLLAGTSKANGLVGTDCYEQPHPKQGDCRIYDYTALFPQTVLEYLEASRDRATAEDLWPLCKRQMELITASVGEDGVVDTGADWWFFIDWDEGLDRQVAEQGVAIFGLKGYKALAQALNHSEEAQWAEQKIAQLTAGAKKWLWNEKRGVFVGKREKEISLSGQAWMTIAGVESKANHARSLKNALSDKSARRPRTPYAMHYFIEALYLADLRQEADAELMGYWGAMVETGADTFYEAFMPGNDRLSPYGDPRVNSYCHAFSCGPTYFLRNPRFHALAVELDETLLRKVKSTYDGKLEPCYFWAPAKAKRERVPLIVGLHTWSCDWRQREHYAISLNYAQRHDWAFVGPNFRGANDHPEACGGEAAVQDIVDAVEYAKGEVLVDTNRIYLIGGSGGGHMTLLMAGRHPEIWAGCAAFCPITDLERWHADSLLKHPGRDAAYAKMLEGACGGTPSEQREEYRRRSPLTYLKNAREAGVPVYIVTGIHDGWKGSVPVGHSFRAFNALADEADRVGEAEIAAIEENQLVPAALAYTGVEDPFYGQWTKIHFRRTSANVRFTLFEGGHGGNFAAGLDFCSRQRKGKAADFSLPVVGSGSETKLSR